MNFNPNDSVVHKDGNRGVGRVEKVMFLGGKLWYKVAWKDWVSKDSLHLSGTDELQPA